MWYIYMAFSSVVVVCIETISYLSDGSLFWKLMSCFIVGYPKLLARVPGDSKHEQLISLKWFRQYVIVLKIFPKEYFWPLFFFLGIITKTYNSRTKMRDKSCHITRVAIESWGEEWRDGVWHTYIFLSWFLSDLKKNSLLLVCYQLSSF